MNVEVLVINVEVVVVIVVVVIIIVVVVIIVITFHSNRDRNLQRKSVPVLWYFVSLYSVFHGNGKDSNLYKIIVY